MLPERHRRTIPAVLLTVLLAFALVFALVIVFPLLTSPLSQPSQQMPSSDWSGYSVASDLNNPQSQVTSISASWTVPTVSVSIGNSYSVIWIGVGGQFDDTLIQAGTEQDSINGRATYWAWYELLPNDAVTIDSLVISPGDRVNASISLKDPTMSTWSIEINDFTNGRSFNETLVYDSSMLSAEWIVEKPIVNNRAVALANFGQVTFTDCRAIVGGKAGTISSFPSSRFTLINRQDLELATVSPASSGGASFTVGFLYAR
jgi:hypothetical protein